MFEEKYPVQIFDLATGIKSFSVSIINILHIRTGITLFPEVRTKKSNIKTRKISCASLQKIATKFLSKQYYQEV